jgi:hypothetical protein
MKINRKSIFTIYILIILFVNGCNNQTIEENTDQTTEYKSIDVEDLYEIKSLQVYDRSDCRNRKHLGIYDVEHKFVTGLNISLTDIDTEKKVDGIVSYSHAQGSGGIRIDGDYYCIELSEYTNLTLDVEAKGYSPIVVKLDSVHNKSAQINFKMVKSCSGGPSCSDNAKVRILENYLVDSDQDIADNLLKNYEEIFPITIKTILGLDNSKYELSCQECYMMYGKSIKVRGSYIDGSEFELFHDWGQQSSSGAGHGEIFCFSTESDDLFDQVINHFCKTEECFENTYAVGNKNVFLSSEIKICETQDGKSPDCMLC